jgi:23S rRNA (uracil1939-C5)-methyltransferase
MEAVNRTAAAIGPLRIEDLDHDGRGVARRDGRAVFVAGALPGELVMLSRIARRADHEEGVLATIVEPSPDRVAPRCAHFGTCGGCALQHLAPAAQLAAKQRSLLDALARLGKVSPERVLAPLAGEPWGYRRRARLGAKQVRAKGRVLVGFRERKGRYIADLARCEVIEPRIGALLPELGALIAGLSIPHRIPQVELAASDDNLVLVLRHLLPLTGADHAALRAFGAAHGIEWWLQPGGEDSAAPLDPPGRPLRYALPAHGVEVEFRPTDFVQVNPEVNRRMVDQALALLGPVGGERVLDLFSGLGNFTLPLARAGAEVLGVEGDAGLVARARDNAARQGLAARFEVADLFQPLDDYPWARRRYHAVLLDPPRAGAREVVARIGRFAPERIVYVSCHPGTLARDAGALVHEHGYRLEAAGAMDMFTHTAHVESMALFTRG